MGAGLLLTAAPAFAADQVYWTNPGNSTISFANLDGSGSGGQVNTGLATAFLPFGIALDAAANKVYWADQMFNTISFANLDGSGGADLDTGTATVSGPFGLAIDPAANKIFWANEVGPVPISFANLDGTGGGDLNTTGATADTPTGIALDPARNKVYWTNSNNDTISFANLDDTGGGGELNTSGATVSSPEGLAIDSAANKIYWANIRSGTISFANLDDTGGGGQLDTAGATVDGPSGVALDPAANKIYWTNLDNGTISFANLDDTGGGGELSTAGATVNNPLFLALLEVPVGAGAPVVSGGSAPGSTLSCSQGAWGADLVGAFLSRAPQGFSYAWTRDGATIPGATANTLVAGTAGDYVCQVTADNHAGTATQTSAAHTVSTPLPPTATTGAASDLTTTSVVLHGTVNPNGSATTYLFQYGTSSAYGQQTSSNSAGSDTTGHAVSASVSGLSPGTVYHFRVVAHNPVGTSDGADQTFTTPLRPLKLSVSPRRTRAATHVCFAFKTTSTGHAVAGAKVRFAGHTARTSQAGKARICLRLRRGTYHPTATRTAYKPARATVTATPKPKPKPTFTG